MASKQLFINYKVTFVYLDIQAINTYDGYTNVLIRSIGAVVIRHSILNLVMALKFMLPVLFNYKIVTMFLVVQMKSDKCQW